MLVLTSVGCGGGGSGSSDDGLATIASAPVDLAPGQTSAIVAWEPSQGAVDGYMVFKSTNDSSYDYVGYTTSPQAEITGEPGDSVRVFVIAQGSNQTQSTSSPASPPIRFHAAAQTAATTASVGTQSSASTAAATYTDPSATEPASSESVASNDEAIVEEESDAESATDTTDAVAPLDFDLRNQLLRSNPRLALGELESNASQWIQSHVDAQVAAGVALAGTGERTGDGRRELVWVDPAGQLFVSDGASLRWTSDVASTFEEAIRLRPTERLVALEDFDGDGLGDWLIEDSATGEVWISESATGNESLSAVTTRGFGDQLVGQGDFDADGRAEILWQNASGDFRLSRSTSALAEIEWLASDSTDPTDPTDPTEGELLAIADLDGDGRDDLLFRETDGRLRLAMARIGTQGIAFESANGPDESAADLEGVATLDFDADGAAEIVWWSEQGIVLWDLQ